MYFCFEVEEIELEPILLQLTEFDRSENKNLTGLAMLKEITKRIRNSDYYYTD